MARNARIRFGQVLVSAMAVLVIGLAGCGSVPTGTESVDDGLNSNAASPFSSPAASPAGIYTSPSAQNNLGATATPSADPIVTATATPTPAPAATPTPTPTVAPTPAPTPVALPAEYAITATMLDTKSSGFLIWQRLTATVEVINPSFLFSQSGTLIVRFTNNGELVETLQQAVTLSPAEIKDFEFKSSQKADAATVLITTN